MENITKINNSKYISNNSIINKISWFLYKELWLQIWGIEDFLDKSWYYIDKNIYWLTEKCIFIVPKNLSNQYKKYWENYNKNLKLKFILIINWYIDNNLNKNWKRIANQSIIHDNYFINYTNKQEEWKKQTQFVYFDLMLNENWKYIPKIINKKWFFRRKNWNGGFDLNWWKLYFPKK